MFLWGRATAWAQLIGNLVILASIGLDLLSVATIPWFVTLLGVAMLVGANVWAWYDARRRPDVVREVQARESQERDDPR